MADYFYAVDLSRNEELARTPSYVDKFLVELVCEDHRTEDNYEPDREHPASEIALEATKQRYGLAATENIGYNRANRYGRRQSQFEELLLSHLDAAYNVAYWLIQNDPDAQKIVQKAFEQACKEFGKHADVRRCLLAFVLRGAHAWIRPRSQPDDRSPTKPIVEKHGQAGPETLSSALRKLPLELREVLLLRELEGWSYQEIAKALETPRNAVAARLSFARRCLRNEVQPAAIEAERLNSTTQTETSPGTPGNPNYMLALNRRGSRIETRF